MKESTRAKAQAHALAEYPREACGLVVIDRGREVYWPCRNLSEGGDQFILSPEDYAAAEDVGQIVAVVHSHPNASAHPSEADRVGCEASGLEWHIVGVPSGVWSGCRPEGYRQALEGREFCHGIVDCYALVRDAYAELYGIELLDFERRDDWWHKGENLYVEGFGQTGFHVVDESEMRVGDVLLMQILSPVPNHAAVLVEDNVILHHLHGRLSSRDVFGGYFRKVLTHVLRHKDR